jgi:hypothetical protein
LLFGDLLVVREQHLAAVGLRVDIDQEDALAFSGEAGGKRNS